MFHPDLVPNRKHLFDKQNIANVYQTMFDKQCEGPLTRVWTKKVASGTLVCAKES